MTGKFIAITDKSLTALLDCQWLLFDCLVLHRQSYFNNKLSLIIFVFVFKFVFVFEFEFVFDSSGFSLIDFGAAESPCL